MFDVPDEDSMYDEYRVLPRHKERLQHAIDEQLDLDRFDYFVSYRRSNEQAAPE